MTTITSIHLLRSLIPESAQPWLIAALRQDIVVWQHLNNPDFLPKLSLQIDNNTGFKPEAWSPAALSLLALNQPLTLLDVLKSTDPVSLDNSLIHQAERTVEAASMPEFQMTLEHAGLIAIALRIRYQSNRSWHAIAAQLEREPSLNYATPLACLLSIAPDLPELLTAFAHRGASISSIAACIHALLSNPLPPSAQLDILYNLTTGKGCELSPAERLMIFRAISSQRPQLAFQYSQQWLTAHPTSVDPVGYQSHDPLVHLRDIEELIFQEEVHRLAGNKNETLHLLTSIRSIINTLLASITHYQEQIAPPTQALPIECINAETKTTLPEDIPLLIEIAASSLQNGDHHLALSSFSKALSEFGDPPSDSLRMLSAGATIWPVIRKLAVQIPSLKKDEEELLHRISLSLQPSDVDRLADAAVFFSKNRRWAEAVLYLTLAVMLNPERLDLRQSLAANLENAEEWPLALQERLALLTTSATQGNPVTPNELHAIANCAIHAGQPQQALEACRQASLINTQDSMTIYYQGAAEASLGNTRQAIDLFTQATEMDCQSPLPWLALARLNHNLNQPQAAIETLQSATLAIPESSEIYHQLGVLYLAQASPTQALTNLERAAFLAPQNTTTALLLGKVYHQLGHLNEAEQVLEASYNLSPDSELAYAYAQSLLSLGKINIALGPLDSIMQSNPANDPGPYLAYAQAILAQDPDQDTPYTPEKAIKALERALDISPGLPQAQGLMAEILAAAGDHTASMQAYQIAMESPLMEDPAWSYRLSLGLGRTALAAGKPEIALASLQEAAQSNPNDPVAYQDLSQAYLSTNLIDDASRAAHTALNLATDDLDILVWFAEQIRAIYFSQEPRSFSTSSPQQALAEALNALTRGIELAPERADLFVRLGELQILSGDSNTALETFHQVGESQSATNNDLRNACNHLLEFGDYSGGIYCLEKACQRELQQDGNTSLNLLKELIQAYRRSGNPQQALVIIDKTLASNPEKAGSIYHWKAKLLIEMGQVENAKSCLAIAIMQTPSDASHVDLHTLMAYLYRADGELPLALKHTTQAIKFGRQFLSPADHTVNLSPLLAAYNLAAELRWSLLQPEQAHQLLLDEVTDILPGSINSDDYLNYLCLRTELALEAGEEVEASPTFEADIEGDSMRPRQLALKARLSARHGDETSALHVFQSALELYNTRQSSLDPHSTQLFQSYGDCMALVEAALELKLWKTALELLHTALESTLLDPRARLSLARAIILRAEYQELCTSAEVINYAPGQVAISPEAKEAYLQTIQLACHQLTLWAQEYPDMEIQADLPLFVRWQARGDVLFSNDQQLTDALKDLFQFASLKTNHAFLSTYEDAASLIAAYNKIQRQGVEIPSLAAILQAARPYPHNLLVLTQIAITLTKSHPRDAMKTLQTALNINTKPSRWLSAIDHALLARFAYTLKENLLAARSIEAALEIWPEEPRWRALAAEICLTNKDHLTAISHLEEAVRQEPKYLPHHLRLGSVYLLCVDQDASYQKKAISAYERACQLAPGEPETWMSLAKAQSKINNIHQATESVDKALSLAPDHLDALELRAEIALQANDYDVAYEMAQKASLLQPNNTSALLVLARTLESLNRPAEALQAVDEAMQNTDDPLPLQLKHAELISKLQGPEAALDDLKSLAERHPNDPLVLISLARIYADCGQEESAIQAAQHALQVGNGSLSNSSLADLHFLIGHLLHQVGQLDQSIHHLDKAIQYAPYLLEPYLELGMARKERREYQQALQVYQQATNIAADDPRPFYQAGLALKEGKDYRQSEIMLRRAASLAPNDINIRRQLAAVVALNLVHNPKAGRMIGE